MPLKVWMTDDATGDLAEIVDYIEQHDLPGKAGYILDEIEKVCKGLASNPRRGAYPSELLDVGVCEYRQVQFKPYRVIYRVIGEDVYVLLIADGRRDMQTLLQRRLLQTFR
jgi:toxin ParE1/3/4